VQTRESSGLMRDPLGRNAVRAALDSSRQYRRIVMRAYLQTSGALFALISVAHLLRLFRHWPIDLAGYTVPLWVSWLGLFLAGGLSIWARRLMRATP
jgi:hypothetical protein